ncbi:MAG: hypothetical protein ACKV2T_06215 [Kofleriaceae bacterium]
MTKIAILVLLVAACGDNSNTGNGDGGVGDDANTGCTGLCDDAPPFGGACDPLSPNQCSNCMDDDGDGSVDGFDIHCAGPLDDDESTFGTGIPGDNIDAVKQDCFFDGNSGAGNDGCDIHVCCILGAMTVAECPIGANRFKPQDCPPPIGNKPLSQQCIDNCGAITPPNCDCFGCCTVCDPNNPATCYDIATNPSTSPDCTSDVLADPTKCLRCTKNTACSGNEDCSGGQTCTEQNPACPAQTFCSQGCCIGVIL